MVERYHGLYFCVKLCSREVRPIWDYFPAIIFHKTRCGIADRLKKKERKK